ncbi:MAG: tetratricopeptide repeat protein [Planctomycetota bacterium]|nr:tetratricopeptide repeat protein [Planctomycetota bacterium]
MADQKRNLTPVPKTLLLTDLVESTQLVATLGDVRAAEVLALHDRAARDLLARYNGLEIDKTDGFLFLFDRPIDAAHYAIAYGDVLGELSVELNASLAARQGMHFGEVLLHENTPEDVARGAKPIEVEGLAKPTAARVMSLATAGQTLMTRTAFDLARRAAIGDAEIPEDTQWLDHGPYLLKGVPEPVQICEVGRKGRAPLKPPPNSEKATRSIAPGDEVTLGWRPAVGLDVPGRSGWKLVRKIGEGGFGEVWLAQHYRTRGSRTFKFCFDASRLRSLKRELRLFRLIKETLGERPDIAHLYEVRLDVAPYFLEMEYARDGDLFCWSEAKGGIGAVPLKTRMEIVAQASQALAAAHSVGVIHRDVKPLNILIDESKDGRVQVRLTDFGIGELIEGSELKDANISVEGPTTDSSSQRIDVYSRTDTRLYMAPELLVAKPSSIQSDIYALGVLLYQMVVGDLSRPLGQGWEAEVSDEILREDISACVGGTPSSRLPSAEMLFHLLRALDERRADRKSMRGSDERERRRRHRVRLASVGAGALMLIAIVAGTGYWQAQNEIEKAHEVTGFLQDMLAQVGPGRLKGREVTIRYLLDWAGERVEAELGNQPEVEAAIRQTLGETYRELGFYKEAGPHLIRALEIRRDVLGNQDPDVAETLHSLSGLATQTGDFAKSIRLEREALEIRRRRYGDESPQVADSLTYQAAALKGMKQYDGAEKLYREALVMRRNLLGEDHADVAASLNNLATCLKRMGGFTLAERRFQDAVDLIRKLGDDDDYRIAKGLNNVASCLVQLGDYDKAEAALTEALQMKERLLEPDDPSVAQTLHDLSSLNAQSEDFEAAEAHCRRALLIRRERLGEGHHATADTLTLLGWILMLTENAREAEPLFREALTIQQAAREASRIHDWKIAQTKASLGVCLERLGQNREAAELLKDSVSVLKRQLSSPDWKPDGRAVADTFHLLGWVRMKSGHPKVAQSWLRDALEVRREQLSPGHWRIVQIEGLLGRCLATLGECDEAKAMLASSHSSLTRKFEQDDPRALSVLKLRIETHEACDEPSEALRLRTELEKWGARRESGAHPK